MRETLPYQQQKLRAMEKRMMRGGEIRKKGKRKALVDRCGRLRLIPK